MISGFLIPLFAWPELPTDPNQNMAFSLGLAGVAFVVTLLIGGVVIDRLRRHKLGKEIRIDGPQSHMVKRGTPTMGGIMIFITIVAMTLLFDIAGRTSVALPVLVLIGVGIIGGLDDLRSLVDRSRGGMSAREKFAWLMGIAVAAGSVLHWGFGLTHIYIPFLGKYDIGIAYVFVAAWFIAGTAHSVNLTDGLDTLAPGLLAIAFVAYGIIAYQQGQIGVVTFCFIAVGALMGFLWFNAHPADVFMGDLGALGLGAALATCAFMTGQWFLLPVIGAVFFAETLSVMIQVAYFKRTGGKRVFKMTPLHHHFQLSGWGEPKIATRFWLIGMICGLLGVALALL